MNYSTIKIERTNGNDSIVSYSEYKVEFNPDKSVLQVLKDIFSEQDRTISFRRYCCNRGVCGSCTMIINEKVKRACVTGMTKNMSIKPLHNKEIIKDLVSKID